jgi:HSP20 family protein
MEMTTMLVPRFDIAFRPFRSLFEEWFNPYPSDLECGEWMPASDIAETDKAYAVTMELPGIDMKKTDISYNDGVITVKGEKIKETLEGECCHCAERFSGSFTRSFRISGGVDRDKIDATYKDGILKVVLPKSEESMPKKITIH